MISTEIWRHVESFDELTPLQLFEHVRGYSPPDGLAHTEAWDTISNMDDRELRAFHVGLHATAVADQQLAAELRAQGEIERERLDAMETPTLGPCGCTDYHMADCGVGGAWLAPSDEDPDAFYDAPDVAPTFAGIAGVAPTVPELPAGPHVRVR